MRVHLVTDQFCLGGGIEHIFMIVQGLPGIEFHVFGEAGPAVEKFKGMPHVVIHDQGFNPGEITSGSPGIIHIHHLRPLDMLFNHSLRKNRYGVPIIFTVHGLHIHKYEFCRTIRARLAYFSRFHLEKRLFKQVNQVIAVSREDQVFMQQEYGLTNVTYLTNGIDLTRIMVTANRTKKEIRQALGVPERAFVFVTAARFNFQKGYDIFLKALASIKGLLEREGCFFLLAGDGEEWAAMKKMSQDLGVEKYMRFLGARGDVYDIIRCGDVFLLPSRWEGLPISLLEAGILKTPVIASATYGNREIIKPGCGILFKNLDSQDLGRVIGEVLAGQYRLDTFVENLYHEVRSNYDLIKMLKGLTSLYKGYSLV